MFLRPSAVFRCMFSWGVLPWGVLPSLHTAACSAGMCSPRYGCVQGAAREHCGRAERVAQPFWARPDRKSPRLALLTLLESFVRQIIIGNNHSAALHTGSKSAHYIKQKSLACTEANLHRKEESTKAVGLAGTCSRLGMGRTTNGANCPVAPLPSGLWCRYHICYSCHGFKSHQAPNWDVGEGFPR